jgi:putative acetyltransferase
MNIRPETASDIEVISRVTKAAFAQLAISDQTEQFIINALRAANALTFSLVAEIDGKVVGHLACSPVTISDGSRQWYGFGPLSVLPEQQKRGIGSTLMREGISLLKTQGAHGIVLVGDPHYYVRFGFRSLPELTYEGVPQEYVLALRLSENKTCGVVAFHHAFTATE